MICLICCNWEKKNLIVKRLEPEARHYRNVWIYQWINQNHGRNILIDFEWADPHLLTTTSENDPDIYVISKEDNHF